MTVEPLSPGDRHTVATLFAELGEMSRRFRFLGPKPALSEAELEYLAATDDRDRVALVALADEGQPIGIARFVREQDDPATAEFACAVADGWQRRGVGTEVARQLARRAREVGIERFHASVLASNAAGLGLLRRLGEIERMTIEGGTLEVDVRLSTRPRSRAGGPSGGGVAER